MRILASYISCIFQVFESFLRTEIEVVEDDTRLVLKEYISSFVTYELESGTHTFKDLSEVLFNVLQLERSSIFSVVFDFDVVTMKTKLVVRPRIIAIRFDKK